MRRMLPLLLLLLAACGGEDDPVVGAGSSAPATNPPTTPAESPVPVAATIRAGDFSFSPRTLTIARGTTVTVTNSGQAPHTFTSKPGQALTWNVEVNERGDTGSFRFTTPGTYEYVCTIHEAQGMTGTVTVT